MMAHRSHSGESYNCRRRRLLSKWLLLTSWLLDMYHTAPPLLPPPRSIHYGPPLPHLGPSIPPPPPLHHPHDHWFSHSQPRPLQQPPTTPRPHPTTPISSSPRYPPPYPTSHSHSLSFQPRQIPTTPQTPQTPLYPSTPHSHGYPPTPHTPHYPAHPHHSPITPQSAHASTSRKYYPSPPPHRYHHHQHAGPSRPSLSHTHTYSHAGPSYQTQLVYRSPNPAHQSYPHSAPPRIMQSWTHEQSMAETRPSPTGNRPGTANGPMDEKNLMNEFLDMGDHHAQEPHDPAPLYQQQPNRTLNILEWGPESGRTGDELTVNLEIDYPADSFEDRQRGVPGRAFRMVIGTLPVGTKVNVAPPRTGPGRSPTATLLTLVTKIPGLHLTGQTTRTDRAPIYVECLRGHDVVDSALVGHFVYTNLHRTDPNPNYQVQSVAGVKRGGEELELEQQQSQSQRPWTGVDGRTVGDSHQSHPYQTINSNQFQQSDQNQLQVVNYQPQPQEAGSPLGTSLFFAVSGPGRGNVADSVVEWSGKPPIALTSTGLMPSVMEPAPPPPVLPPIPSGCQPSLVRSSQMPASGNNSWYDRLKAEIVFQNDLLSMTKAWTAEEWANKRRLVKVWRRQHESQIFMAFRPVSFEEYPLQKDSVIVSCIFRDDRNSCFITSVDIIYLLEAVIGQRFTIEEKNRIRRNLEGFRPQTCSKTKPGSEEFFRTVMAFGEPKPRNIEKDLKVFQWDILPAAVKKIISKYVSCLTPTFFSPARLFYLD